MKMASMPTVYRIEMSSGVATNATNRSRKVIVRVRLEADAMFMITGPAPVCAVRLFSWASKSCVLGDEVHDMGVNGFRSAEGHGLANRHLQLVAVAAALLGDAAHEGRGVVGDLLLEGPADVSPRGGHRGCRADVVARHHRTKVGGGQNERAGGCGARPLGCHVHSHGHVSGQQALDDLARG